MKYYLRIAFYALLAAASVFVSYVWLWACFYL